MRVKATIEDAAPYLLSKREMQKIGRAAIEAAGKLWHSQFKRFHFTKEAFQRYRYRPRSRKWEAIKARQHPENAGRPLVFTGESEQRAMAANRVVSRAPSFDKYHADVTVSAPRLNFHGREVTKTIPAEDEAMQAKFAEVFTEGVVDAWRGRGLSEKKIELGRGQLFPGV